MNKSPNIALVIFGYTIIEIVALAASFVISFITWGMLSYNSTPDGATPGDGFGFILILAIGVPIWIIVAILSPIVAHIIFKEPSKRLIRIAFSLLTPVITAMVSATATTLFL